MILKRRAALDGVQLDELDKRILIQGVDPGAGKDALTTVSLFGAGGSRVTSRHRDSIDATVTFSIDIKPREMEQRTEVFRKVLSWAARGGWLTLSQKPGQQLRVIAAQLPSEGDPLAWTNRYTITFRAFGVPYWQDALPNSMQNSGAATADKLMSVGGNTATVCDAEFTNTSGGAIQTLDLSCGGSAFHFAGLALANGETLCIDHHDIGEACTLRIRIKSTGGVYRSAMNKRTGTSSDDLRVEPGTARILMTAGGAGTLRVCCAGRWL